MPVRAIKIVDAILEQEALVHDLAGRRAMGTQLRRISKHIRTRIVQECIETPKHTNPPYFGYKCQTCGRGTVTAKFFEKYPTKIRGQEVEVPDAIVGICNVCDEKHFSARETKRWLKLFKGIERKTT